MRFRTRLWTILLVLSVTGLVTAQEDSPATKTAAERTTDNPDEPDRPAPAAKPGPTTNLPDSVDKIASQAEESAIKIAKTIDQDPNAKTAAAGILQPIYFVAESLAFPAFHWLAFALMATGVISFALQLVLGKIVVLMRFGFSLKEIISDATGLAISVIGLVLTTQAAAENSTFTRSPAAVISATLVGIIVGVILYRWGQSQEIEAAAGRTAAAGKGKN